MWFIATVEVGADPLGKLFSRKQAIAFDDSTLGMDPLWLDGIEPGAFCGQKARQNPNAFALLLDLAVVLANPGAYHLAHMEGGISERLSSQAVFPWACSRVQHHCRNWVVISLTGRPVTKRSDI